MTASPTVRQSSAIETSEKELEEKGFDFDRNDSVRISSNADALDAEYEAAVEHAVRAEISKVKALQWVKNINRPLPPKFI